MASKGEGKSSPLTKLSSVCYSCQTMLCRDGVPLPDTAPRCGDTCALPDELPNGVERRYRYRHLGGIEGLRALLESHTSLRRDAFQATFVRQFADTILASAFETALLEAPSDDVTASAAYRALSNQLRRVYHLKPSLPGLPAPTAGRSMPELQRRTRYRFQAEDHIGEFYLSIPNDDILLECFRDECLFDVNADGRRVTPDPDQPDAKLHVYQCEILRSNDHQRRVIGFATLQLFDGRRDVRAFLPEANPLQYFDEVADVYAEDAVTPPGILTRCQVSIPVSTQRP